MLHSLIPWSQLTRTGIPVFRAVRRDIVTGGRIVVVGEEVPADLFSSRHRMRQLYEQRLIEPTTVPPGSRQLMRERMAVNTAASTMAAAEAEKPVGEGTRDLNFPSIPIAEEGVEDDRVAEADPVTAPVTAPVTTSLPTSTSARDDQSAARKLSQRLTAAKRKGT